MASAARDILHASIERGDGNKDMAAVVEQFRDASIAR
jgi:hypothetical protein